MKFYCPGETFRILKEKKKQYGEYRTRRLVLEAWDRLRWQNKEEVIIEVRGPLF